MKIKKAGIFLTFTVLLLALITLSACFVSDCKYIFGSCQSKKIDTPVIKSYGLYMAWDKIDGAAEYDIYQDNEVVKTVTENKYEFREIKTDAEFCVVAKAGKRKSEKSETLKVSKNCNFTSDETIDLSDKKTFSGNISSSVRKVIIKFEKPTTITFKGTILERNTDLFFELENVEISGFITTHDDTHSRQNNNYNVFIDVKGIAVLKEPTELSAQAITPLLMTIRKKTVKAEKTEIPVSLYQR